MKQILCFMLLVLMASTTLFAQDTNMGFGTKRDATRNFVTHDVPDPAAAVQAIAKDANEPVISINPMIEVPATLHVLPGTGELVVYPASLTETHEDAFEITSQTLELTNNTGATVSWTLAIDAGVDEWLTAAPISGTINSGQTIPINVTFNSEGLDWGTYNGSITISSSQPDIVVPVTLIVGDVLPPPTNLAYTIEDFINVNLTWDAPASGGFDPEWITYSTGVITNSIGAGAISFDVAARWTPDMLAGFEGGMVTKIEFVPGEPGNVSSYMVKVWQGGNNNPTLKYSQSVTNIVEDQWNVVTLIQPVAIDITQELWIGFSVNTTGGYPAGCDGGPQAEGFGNMMFMQGGWTTLSQLSGLDYNWAVKGFVAGGMQVEGYNVYRKDGYEGSFNLIGNTNANTLTYYDDNLYYNTFYYHVKAQYAAGLSEPSNEVMVSPGSISDPSGASSSLQIYPNPAKDQFTIKFETELQSVIMVNYSGQVVMNRKATGNELLINANEFAKGVYTLQVETKDGRSVHKVVIQ